MNIFDYTVLSILAISIFISILRGLLREVLSIAGWVIAFLAAGAFATDFEPMLPAEIGGESLRMIVSYVVLFISVLLVSGLVTMLLSAVIKGVGLGLMDRVTGAVFGFLRGFAIIIILVLIAGLTAVPQASFWQQAQLSGFFESTAMFVKRWLPYDLSKRISYENADDAT